jgi:chromosomal replication initiation ATPase DnaA
MTRNQLIKKISGLLEVNLIPAAYNVLVDILQEYESEYLKDRIRAYRVGGLVSDEMLNENAQNICNMYGITIDQLKSKGRYSLLVMARVHFSRHMRLIHNASFQTIGKFLNRDHTTILHYFKAYKIDPNISEIHTRLTNDRKTDTRSGVQVY